MYVIIGLSLAVLNKTAPSLGRTCLKAAFLCSHPINGKGLWKGFFMNISTGGPHILLFERDQQLAALLTSELQLAGYECHIARTAVEVFDAIARFPVRLVLINLAQAAASRREFWVALDTQRRGSGIQVFTFHCSNLAGYGPRDPDDYGQTSMADMEIDGMVGLMKLVDTVRRRVPDAEGNTTTMPRIPRTPIQNDLPELQSSTSSRFADSQNALNPVNRLADQPRPQPSMNTAMQGQSGPNPLPLPPSQGASQVQLATSPVTQMPMGDQATYSEKIRAVLYPHAHSPMPNSEGGVKGNNGVSPRYSSYAEPDTSKAYSPQIPSVPITPAVSTGTSALQRLANGQFYSSPGLTELSRLISEYKSSDMPANGSTPIAYQPWATESMRPSPNMRVEPVGAHAPTYTPTDLLNEHLDFINPMSSLSQTETDKRERGRDSQAAGLAQSGITASLPTVLRAAPIEDLPVERLVGNQPAYGMAVKPSEGSPRAREALPPQSLSELSLPTQPSLGRDEVGLSSMTTSTTNWPVETSPLTSFNAPLSGPVQSIEEEVPLSRESGRVSLTTESAYQRENTERPRRVERPQKAEATERHRQSDRLQESAYQRENTERTRRVERPQKAEATEQHRQSDRLQESAYQRENTERTRRVERPQKAEATERHRQSDRLQESAYQRENTERARRVERSQKAEMTEPYRQSGRVQQEVSEASRQSDYSQDSFNISKELEAVPRPEHVQESVYQILGKDIDEGIDTRNAVILDILQSLPAVTTPSNQQEQAIQPQVHQGRATRSLGNVLLDGHLVPQDRLEVAQNIQRMLRGVDMNYQLGEILLMFKLLTPDQLLAASLVGYGLITRTQISALGRIRQELHAIGLEYDLENLVILFRILTPEQVREAKSSVLG